MKAPFWQVTGAKRCGRRGAVCARSACRRAQSRPLWRLSGAGGGARARRELAAGEALLRAAEAALAGHGPAFAAAQAHFEQIRALAVPPRPASQRSLRLGCTLEQ